MRRVHVSPARAVNVGIGRETLEVSQGRLDGGAIIGTDGEQQAEKGSQVTRR